MGQRAQHVGRTAAGGNAAHHIARCNTDGFQRISAGALYIFHSLTGPKDSLLTPGDESLHHVRRGAEGGGTLGGIQQTPAFRERVDDQTHRSGDIWDFATYGDRHEVVLRINHVQCFLNRRVIDCQGVWVALLCGQLSEGIEEGRAHVENDRGRRR